MSDTFLEDKIKADRDYWRERCLKAEREVVDLRTLLNKYEKDESES